MELEFSLKLYPLLAYYKRLTPLQVTEHQDKSTHDAS